MDLLGIVGVASDSVAIPLSTATSIATISRGVRAQQVASDAVGDPRLAKFSLHASCQDVRERDVKIIVLRNGRLYLDSHPAHPTFEDGHPFSGFYLDYPGGDKPMGLVSTISEDLPELNWNYTDFDTLVAINRPVRTTSTVLGIGQTIEGFDAR
ncbi:hypothetical protein B0H13DRAFT_2409453 [Mycena leptocephala]|nr:hypothetical protein B0H13DRAFT_2409453 [Mycena leptocephala]